MLGINETLHNICFTWVLFHRYVVTREVENDLLFASCNLLKEVEKDTEAMKDPIYSKALSSTLSLMLGWAEKRPLPTMILSMTVILNQWRALSLLLHYQQRYWQKIYLMSIIGRTKPM
ncbi:hypothetical protein MtrunA17_Chr1g0211761 [Medicago truncatula]|uniref:Uncharacterized protein n=1 Tax=Medicago truncatula TaxID=3880 RepID=A0A396JWA0_MEDTR|nr:hypothetical protein MtrunA17_Chr1g0211761 [Medicago truncatula]